IRHNIDLARDRRSQPLPHHRPHPNNLSSVTITTDKSQLRFVRRGTGGLPFVAVARHLARIGTTAGIAAAPTTLATTGLLTLACRSRSIATFATPFGWPTLPSIIVQTGPGTTMTR